ncbi:MAG TPA: hypothetical protein VFA18_03510 [Gemmataceae bacterium]|nr:hypothetical protein [Gemmataceae bacterium]
MTQAPSQLRAQLEHQVRTGTSRRVRDLAVELSPDAVILRGRTTSYHIKQLAQHSVRSVLPRLPVLNAIVVDSSR